MTKKPINILNNFVYTIVASNMYALLHILVHHFIFSLHHDIIYRYEKVDGHFRDGKTILGRKTNVIIFVYKDFREKFTKRN